MTEQKLLIAMVVVFMMILFGGIADRLHQLGQW